MKFSYKFSNLLGAVYRHGNLSFSKDGNSVISPVGNRVSVFDLKNNKSETLPVSTNKNITSVGLSPDGNLAILVDEDGAAVLVSLLTRAVLYHHHFHKPVHSVSFSPDGRKFVVTKENVVLMYHAPGKNREFNAFVLDKSYYGPYDETTCIDWTDDSKCFAVGSKDMSTWIFGAERWANLIYYSLGGHRDIIVGCFFEKDSLDLYTVSQDGTLCVWESDAELEDLRKGSRYLERKKMEEERKRRAEEEPRGEVIKGSADSPQEVEGIKNVRFKQKSKHFFSTEGICGNLTAAAFHKDMHILVTGFASGAFHLHELPEFNLIHSLSISDQRISAIAMNPTGDWIGFGCSGLGQLLVWEWQSESYVFKQQGHFNNMASLAYSPDGQAFTSLCYSADGESLLAGGRSKFVCIYNIKEQILMKKFEISCNMSLDAMEEFLDRRKMTEFGSLALVDEGAGDGDGVHLTLPGVKRGDMSSRHFKPEIRVTSLRFSPTALHVLLHHIQVTYSDDAALTSQTAQLQTEQQLAVVSSSLPDVYVEKLLNFVASSLEKSRHLQFYLTWAQNLLTLHGQKLKSRSTTMLPTIQQLLKSLQKHHDDLSKLCDWNIYTIRYAKALSKQRGMKRTVEDSLSEEGDGSEIMGSEDEEEEEEEDMMSEPILLA
uniref:PWP2 small subunit processome component n=1 Tax=Astyanax mexicanus TaxID=7994 RepID=A0A8B9HX14_ASTMX